MATQQHRIKVFQYLPELDCFQPTEEYKHIATELGIAEWNPVVWIGRYFAMDNDFGEHWFDNWNERDAFAEKAKQFGYNPEKMLIVVPERFKDGRDGPCHPDNLRKQFWTDVLDSMHLSLDTLVAEARYQNIATQSCSPEDTIDDLEERIREVHACYESSR